MKKIVIILIFLFINSFASNKESLMNDIKSLIQKEEYLAIAINKYILQTGQIPPRKDGKIDFETLKEKKYLDSEFDAKTPFLNSNIKVNFDTDTNSAFIVSLIEKEEKYNNEHKYLYEFYTNNNFRVNTLAPNISDEETKKANLAKGTQIIYNDIQREIVNIINKNVESILLENQTCTVNNYFYELANEKLVYKYCKTNNLDASKPIEIKVYQESPIILDDNLSASDLRYIKPNIGDTAFVKEGNSWVEYYFHGELVTQGETTTWSKVAKLNTQINPDDETISQKVASYIPNAKDFYIRQSSGCYLANGDIYCWGKNNFNQAGITAGQMDTILKPDYVNTPIMLKSQIDKVTIDNVQYDIKAKNWYNSPFRVKFDKIGVNSTNVCGITKIFKYTQGTTNYKFGGDLYCNGSINSTFYEDLTTDIKQTPILKRNIEIYKNKSTKIESTNAKYLVDIAMVDDAIAVLDDKGKIYTIGKNYKGSLGVDKTDYFYFSNTPIPVNAATTLVFKKIFALRDSRTFGAIDSNNQFYIWGDRGTTIITKPTLVTNTIFNPDAIFVNTNEFILKGVGGGFYKTNGSSIEAVSSTILSGNPISVSYYKDNSGAENWLYIDENLKLKGNSNLLTCKESNQTTNCNDKSKAIFNDSLDKLNAVNTQISYDYANFTNVSIFKLDHQIKEISENFENGWNKELYHDGGSQSTRFLGRWASNSNGTDFLNKTYDFGMENANKNITINLDFYEIDSWDRENFIIYLNGEVKHNNTYLYNSSNEGGISLKVENYESGYRIGEKHKISIQGKLDSKGKIRLGFSSSLNEALNNESWGVDNIEIIKNEDNKLLSFEDFETKIYEDWNRLSIHDGGSDSTRFLGRWASGSSAVDYVNKTYDFGIDKAGLNITVELDLYEIDTWDSEFFKVYINGEEKYNTNFSYLKKEGKPLTVINYDPDYTLINYSERHKISVTGNLDSRGKLRLGFSSTLDESITNESWGVDNIKITDNTSENVLSLEDFESKWNNEWNRLAIHDGGAQATNFLGRWASGSSDVDYVNKTYDFGILNKNEPVIIKLDFYEIDSWDGENFKIYLNGEVKHNSTYRYSSNNEGGTPLIVENYDSVYRIGEKHKISVEGSLNSDGKIRLGFSSSLNEALNNESWGVDNIEIFKKSDNTLLGKEDFEKNVSYVKSSYEGWSNYSTKQVTDNGTNRTPATTFLGKFPIVDCQTGVNICDGKPFEVSKKYSFGSLYANYEIDIEFDFYEIDSWDGERFEFYANETLLAVDHFVKDNHYSLLDSNITGIPLQKNVGNNQSENPQKYTYKLRSVLDSNGEVTLKFKTNWETNLPYLNYYSNIWYIASGSYYEDVENESWGIDNIKIKLRETDKRFVCAMTGVEQSSQMYCWGNVARSLPILNTSLYDSDKITTLNKLFFTQNQDINKQISFDTYDQSGNGMLFLKYPTYISGFDYPFYFK